MNRDEAKTILLLYRPGTADAGDPQIAGALALAQRDLELTRWLDELCARQQAVRAKFRQIAVPAGLKEQIISERAVRSKKIARREKLTAMAAVTAIVVSLIVLMPFWLPRRVTAENTLANYKSQMVSVALRGYGMDLMTNDPAKIRDWLNQKQAPADYVLPAGLQKAAMIGCATEGWQTSKVSMICFRTGRPLPPGQQSDLWLFVVDRASLKDAPAAGPPRLIAVNRLITAVWARGDKVYLLGTEGDESTIRKFL